MCSNPDHGQMGILLRDLEYIPITMYAVGLWQVQNNAESDRALPLLQN